MLNPRSDIKFYLCTGYTDMRKGAASLSMLAESLVPKKVTSGAMFIFRGRNASKLKILWWDGQGFCMLYKCFDRGRFVWHKSEDKCTITITRAQLSMLMEGIDWRTPSWSEPPQYVC